MKKGCAQTPRNVTLALLLGACSGPAGDPPADQAAAVHDLALPAPDLAEVPVPADLAVEPDLSTPPMLMDVPECAAASVNAATLYSQVASTKCTARYCHGTSDPVANFSFNSAATMRTAWVGRLSSQSGMPFIVPRSLDRSYVLWKLLGQHERVARGGLAGSRMPPPPRDALPTADLCLFINWVRSGAS